MSDTTKKPRRPQTALELPAPARGALRRMKKNHGISHTAAVTRGVLLLESTLQTGRAA